MYLRQSLDRTGEGLAVARQREDCLKLCDLRGWEPREYEDNDTSASSGVRPNYQRMLHDIESGAIRAVVAWDLDRLHRRPIELEHFMELADKNGIALATVTGDVDLSTDNGRLFARIKGAVARSEVERKSARQKRAARQTAEDGKGWGGLRAFGYTQPGNKIVPWEANLVREAYSSILEGSTLRSVALKWNSMGVTTTRGNKWSGSTVRQVLVNPRYAGMRTYKGEIVSSDADWAGLIAEDKWRAVVAILTQPQRRKGSNARKNLLTGILLCGRVDCGRPMGSGVSQEGDAIYTCKHCFRNSRRLIPVDALVGKIVVAYFSQDDAQELLVDRDRVDLGELRELEKTYLQQLDTAAVDHYSKKRLSESQYNAVTADIQQNLDSVQEKMRSATKVEVFQVMLESKEPQKTWEGLSLDRKRAIVRHLMRLTLLPAGRGQKFTREQLVIDPLTAED